jgi:ribosomal protein S9
VTIEARIADAMARLCFNIRKLDQPQFAGLRAMLPQNVAEALDIIVRAENDGVVGRALAVVVQAAQGLSDLQFKALRPIAPSDVAHVIEELRAIFRENEVVITPDSPR